MSKIVPKFSPNAQVFLCKRYLRKGDDCPICTHCNAKHETPEEMIERVSFGNEAYFNLLASLDFLPNSPTLFNAAGVGTLSACFKFDVQDTMESILDVGSKSALVQKWGGGVGFCLSELRPKGAHIRSTHGKACGPVAVMRFYHAIAEMITQGGKREGAQMAILHCDHPDIEEFIHCKENEGTLDTFNISVAVTDDFMRKAVEDTGRAQTLFDEIVKNAWSNGDPGLFFIDAAERANPTPHLGKLTGTNPCGEVPLLDNESCNLGSINLSHFVLHDWSPGLGGYDRIVWDKLEAVVRLAVRYLDRVIEENYYPISEIKEATLKTRKLGLGVMGWADTLALMKIPYDSQEAVDLAGEIMKTIQEVACDESIALGKAEGAFPSIKDSMYWNPDFKEGEEKSLVEVVKDVLDTKFMRNACVTCIAPTGSISTLANCSSGIEPHYSLEYTQIMGDGTKLGKKLDFGDFVPKTAHEISHTWHVKHQAAFQVHTDLAVSKTINMPSSATIEDVRSAYIMAWELGCKGITVYREGSRLKQAMEITKHVPDETLDDYNALVHRFKVGDMKGYLHWGLKSDGSPFEVFITASKQGSTIDGLLDATAILTSMALQAGVSLEDIVHKMRGRRFEPSGLTDNPEIPMASSILDYIARYAQAKFLGVSTSYNSGMVCPDCGASVISQEGCLVCFEKCGWSRC